MMQELIAALLDNLTRVPIYEFLEFIQIRDEFKKRGIVNIKKGNPSGDISTNNELLAVQEVQNYVPQNDEEQLAFTYLKRLNNQLEERVKVFQSMEKNLIGKMQRLSISMIQLLLLGEGENSMGILQILAPQTSEHVLCVHGFKFMRKMFEFEYNPYAENAIRAFTDISFRQVKVIKPASHIGGTTQTCKMDALFVLSKYFDKNGMNDQFVRFMLEDTSAYEEYMGYKNQMENNTLKFRIKTEGDTPGSLEENKAFDPAKIVPTRRSPQAQVLSLSNHDQIQMYLESAPNIEDFYRMTALGDIKWKKVVDFLENENLTLKHVQGKIAFMKYKRLPASLEYARELFTDKLPEWNSLFAEHKVLSSESNSNRVIQLKGSVSKTHEVKIICFFQEEEYQVQDDYILLKSFPPSDTSSYLKSLGRNEEGGSFLSILKFKKHNDGTVSVTTKMHVYDQNGQLFIQQVLLNENNNFAKYYEKLQKLINQTKI